MATTDPAAIVAAARGWIGTPYQHQASLKGVGCDCLGLLRGVWRELHGVEAERPPAYTQDWAEATGEETLFAGFARHLSRINVALVAPGDVALFRMARHQPAKHCGVVGEIGRALTLIHAASRHAVREEPLGNWWRGKLAFVFRVP
jgi:NlpC/P60 family putative phage cell wall peptidase